MRANTARWALTAVLLAPALAPGRAAGQGGYNDNRVMIQGFMWESHQDRSQTAWGVTYRGYKGEWYELVKGKVGELAAAKFDLVWLPPPSEGEGAGYHPRELHTFGNSYGTEAQHRAALRALLEKGVEPVADVVVNHRNGSDGWAVFRNPAWPPEFVCSDDEFWAQNPDNASLSAGDRKILRTGRRGRADFTGSDFPRWNGARDLDHTNPAVRKAVKEYLGRLKRLGYRGWRYDMVKGYAPGYVAEYNFASAPTFAVGEYLDANPHKLTDWVDATKLHGQPDPALRACSAFDFATHELLKRFIGGGQYRGLHAVHIMDGADDGLIAYNRDKAVTFLENHDSGFPQKQFDSFGNDDRLMQGYAYVLTHPGVPCVYWKHYFDWDRATAIRALVRARKYAGVHSGSYVKTEDHGGDYVAVVGDKPTESSTLIVKIGPGLRFNPDGEVWGLEASGNGYAVWVRKTKKAETRGRVDRDKPGFPVPD